KTQPLKTLMTNTNLSPVWENYCLKSTEVDYTAAHGWGQVLPFAFSRCTLPAWHVLFGNGTSKVQPG
ncbi:MAG: hypothetical protein ACREXU_01915, partial [Gammaproteobacteria bacterium]